MSTLDIIRTCILTPNDEFWGLPVLITGAPGASKTAVMRAEARRMALHFEVVIASTREPSEIGGTGVPNEARTTINRLVEEWVTDANDACGALVVFDEFNWAAPTVQSACLRVIHERVVGSTQFHPRVRCVAIQNPQDSGGGGDLIKPMANRFVHLAWSDPTEEEWSSYMNTKTDALVAARNNAAEAPAPKNGKSKQRTPLEIEEDRVLDAWPAAFSAAAAQITAFITHGKRGSLRNEPPAEAPAASGPWASPRTWDMATRALASARIQKLGADDTSTLLCGIVGAGPASEFLTWLDKAELPDAAKLLDGMIAWQHDPLRLDITAAVVDTCVGVVAGMDSATVMTHKKKRADALWKILDHISSNGAFDVITGAIGRLSNERGCENMVFSAKHLKKIQSTKAVQ